MEVSATGVVVKVPKSQLNIALIIYGHIFCNLETLIYFKFFYSFTKGLKSNAIMIPSGISFARV